MTKFNHEVHESTSVTARTETWEAEFPDFRVEVEKKTDGIVFVTIAPQTHFNGRIPFLRLAPTSANDLKLFAEHGPAVLLAVAEAVTAALGTEDWRSRWDKERDELDARFGLKLPR